MPTPTPGQKLIPLGDWKRFLRVADWFEQTVEQGKGVLRPDYGQALIVKTPAGGIPARLGATVYSATCIKCVAADPAFTGRKTLHETNEELLVWNFHTGDFPDDLSGDVPGDAFVKTDLLPNGTRYVVTGPVRLTLRAVKLTENMGATTPHEAAALFRRWDPAARRYFSTTDTVTVYDPLYIFGHGLKFQYGLVWNHGEISELITLTGEWRIAMLLGTLVQGGSEPASVTVNGGTALITVFDRFLRIGGSIASGSGIGVAYDHEAGIWLATEGPDFYP